MRRVLIAFMVGLMAAPAVARDKETRDAARAQNREAKRANDALKDYVKSGMTDDRAYGTYADAVEGIAVTGAETGVMPSRAVRELELGELTHTKY